MLQIQTTVSQYSEVYAQSLMLFHEILQTDLHFLQNSILSRASDRSLTANRMTRTRFRRGTTSHNLTLPTLAARSVRHNNCPLSPTSGRSGGASGDPMFTSAGANSLVRYTASIAAFISISFVVSRCSDGTNPTTARRYPASVFLSESWMGAVNITFMRLEL